MSNNVKLIIYEIGLVLFVLLACFGVGYGLGYYKGYKNGLAGQKVIAVQGKTVTQTVTKIVYQEKTPTRSADINANFGKQDFSIQVNGQTVTFNKSEDERFMFEKNQLQLDQTSKVAFEVKVAPIDITKHYGIGIGYSDGLELIFTAPISPLIDAYIHGNQNAFGVGAMFRF